MYGFNTAAEKLYKYAKNFGENYKNQYILIHFGTPGQHTKSWNCPGKIEAVGWFAKRPLLVKSSVIVQLAHLSKYD